MTHLSTSSLSTAALCPRRARGPTGVLRVRSVAPALCHRHVGAVPRGRRCVLPARAAGAGLDGSTPEAGRVAGGAREEGARRSLPPSDARGVKGRGGARGRRGRKAEAAAAAADGGGDGGGGEGRKAAAGTSSSSSSSSSSEDRRGTSGGPSSGADMRRVRSSGRGGGSRGQRGRGGRPERGRRGKRGRGRGQVSSQAAIALARALASSLSHGDAADVDFHRVGEVLADCKDARTEEASDAAWELYQAAVVSGVVRRFNIRQYNFALGAVQQGPAGFTRVTAIWEAVARSALTPNNTTMALLARGLCRSSSDVSSTLAALREGTLRGGTVDAYVLNVLLNTCLRDASMLVSRRGGGSARAQSPPDLSAAAHIRDSALAVWNAGKGMHNEHTLTSTIKVLADTGDIEEAERVFQGAWDNGVPLDVDCLAIMLRIMSSVSPSDTRSSKDVVALYRLAQDERGMRPTTVCANIVLTACSRDGNYEEALLLWRDMLKRRAPPPDKVSLAAVILSCGRSGRGDLALEAFEEGKACDGVECDTVTVNVLLDACAKSDRPPGEVLDILMDALESGIPVDACTISSLLIAYASPQASSSGAAAASVLDQAFAIVELGRFLHVEPTTVVINSLLRVCVAAGDMPRAVKAFEEAVVTQGAAGPDSRSVSILIEGFAQAGDIQSAVERLKAAAEMGVVITEATVITLIKACVNAGDVETALEVYRDTVKGVEDAAPPLLEGGPSLPMINALLRGLARSGSWQEAIRLVSDDVLSNEKIQADEKTVNLFTRAFEVGGEDEQAKAARLIGIWMQETDDALVAHLLEDDPKDFPN